MTQSILYSFRRCPYAMRARLAIFVSGLSVELREVVLRDKPAEMLTASPKGTVPVLVLPGGEVLEESLDIMLWALHQNDPEGWLAADLEGALELIALADDGFKTHLDRYKYASRYAGIDPITERAAASVFLSKLNADLTQTEYLFGKHRTIADMAIAPFVRQFANVDRGWFEDQPWSALLRWLHSFLTTAPFPEILLKYPQWHAGDPPTLFPALIPEGKP